MAGHVSQRELLAGGAAAALLLLAVALELSPWLAIPLALVTYTGVVWLWHDVATGKPRGKRFALHRAMANATATLVLLDHIDRPATSEQVGRIRNRIVQVLGVLREDGNSAAAIAFNDHLLVPVRALLMEYVRLSDRDIGSARELLEKTETHDLPLIEQALDTFYERLNRSHLVDLATLSELLEINLDSIVTTSSRRLTR